ncbi:MAG: arsenosugar biosynthesis radical SAM protein ArsS [Bdellovibrionales bacterium]|nr:arsenosugar biosynthesis radical SAM protein ArsS [Bdellovibrionales bacterium]
MLNSKGLSLRRRALSTLQVNLGKLCNQACQHCHVEAGPQRTENMELATVEACLRLARDANVTVVDITGGAPELNPHFRYFVSELHKSGVQVIDRCNLTVLWEPEQEDTADFLAKHQVRIIASLPCYSEANVRKQRGSGVFDKSIRALQKLNDLGYAKGNLVLDLVYNPVGAFLPPDQSTLEATYKKRLREDFGIHFNHLFTLTNMPIKRFAEALVRQGKYEEYLDLLAGAFNPASVDGLMCRDLLSVGFDGKLYDCDFNQMLELPLAAGAKTIFDLDFKRLENAPIATASHCFGCTAGSGSSCTGALA